MSKPRRQNKQRRVAAHGAEATARPALARVDATHASAGTRVPAPRPAAPHAEAPRLAGLDGLRGIAVLAVIAYHLGQNGLTPAGFLGVDMFFVISGFIITALLLREHARHGRVDLGAFYLRRARRLLPPAFAMIAVVAVVAPVLAPDTVARLVGDIPAALVYVSNWWQIVSKQSYFETFGSPPLLQHLWSLAVEEQFYIVWPLLAWGALRLGGRRALAVLAVVVALASTAWMAWLYATEIDGGDPSRVYLGSDTHLMGLGIGSALAALWNPWGPPASAVFQRAAGVLGPLALGLLLLAVQFTHEGLAFVYQGGLLLAAVLTALAIVGAAQPGWPMARALSTRPLQWAGSRSFSLYLWHWPVFVIMKSGGAASHPVLLAAAMLLLTAAAAELSYRLVESPLRGAGANPLGRWHTRAVALGASLGTASFAMAWVGPLPMAAPNATAALFGPAQLAEAPAEEAPFWAARGAHSLLALADHPRVDEGPMPLDPSMGPRRRITIVGDSVMLGARDHLVRAIPGALVDAKVGRQGGEGLERIQAFRSAKTLGDIVVLHLGTNGYISERYYREMLKQLSDRQAVVLVNVYADRRWTGPNNQVISRLAGEFSNVRVVDWSGMATRRPDFLVSDGVHLTSAGIRALAGELRQAMGLREAPAPAPRPRVAATKARSSLHEVSHTAGGTPAPQLP